MHYSRLIRPKETVNKLGGFAAYLSDVHGVAKISCCRLIISFQIHKSRANIDINSNDESINLHFVLLYRGAPRALGVPLRCMGGLVRAKDSAYLYVSAAMII